MVEIRESDLRFTDEEASHFFNQSMQLMLAEVSHQKGWTSDQVHPDTVGQTLLKMGVNWRRAKHWINSPDANYSGKKSAETG